MNRWSIMGRRALLTALCALTVIGTAATPLTSLTAYAEESGENPNNDGDHEDDKDEDQAAEPEGEKDYTSQYRYAVRLYGIHVDALEGGDKGGLTFGPATGADYTSMGAPMADTGPMADGTSRPGIRPAGMRIAASIWIAGSRSSSSATRIPTSMSSA